MSSTRVLDGSGESDGLPERPADELRRPHGPADPTGVGRARGSHAQVGHAAGSHAQVGHAPGSHAQVGHAAGSHAQVGHAPGSHAQVGHAPGSHSAITTATGSHGLPTTARYDIASLLRYFDARSAVWYVPIFVACVLVQLVNVSHPLQPGTTASVQAKAFAVGSALIGAILLWGLARRLRLSRPAASAALVVYTISPVALQLHRSVSLADAASILLLGSLVVSLSRGHQRVAVGGGALLLAAAILTQQYLVLALPVIAVLVWRQSVGRSRRRPPAGVLGCLAVLVTAGIGSSVAAIIASAGAGAGAWTGASGFFGYSAIADIARSTGVDLSGAAPLPGSPSAALQWFSLDAALVTGSIVAVLLALLLPRLRALAVVFLLVTAALLLSQPTAGEEDAVVLLPLAVILVAGVVQWAVSVAAGRGRGGVPAIRRAGSNVLLAGAATMIVVSVVGYATAWPRLFSDPESGVLASARSWLVDNVPHTATLIVDPSLAGELVSNGFAAERLVSPARLDSGTGSGAVAGGTASIVGGAGQASALAGGAAAGAAGGVVPTAWNQFDYLVTSNWAENGSGNAALSASGAALQSSSVVAVFTESDLRVEVRRIEVPSATESASELQAAKAARAAAGLQLAANPNLSLSTLSRAALTSGSVDSRIILALGLLLARTDVSVSDFPAVVGESATPERQVLITAYDGHDIGLNEADGGSTADAVAWFEELSGTAAPIRVVPTSDGLVVTYSFGEPAGLLPTPAS